MASGLGLVRLTKKCGPEPKSRKNVSNMSQFYGDFAWHCCKDSLECLFKGPYQIKTLILLIESRVFFPIFARGSYANQSQTAVCYFFY